MTTVKTTGIPAPTTLENAPTDLIARSRNSRDSHDDEDSTEGPTMLTARWALGAAMVTGSLFIGAAATASAEPLPPPPNCTASDLASAMSATAAGTSVYLGTHPDVNAFFTGLKGMPKDQMREQTRIYLDANPQVRDELRGVRQPSIDFHNRCG